VEERESKLEEDTRRWDTIAERAGELAERLRGALEGSHAQMLDFEPAEYLTERLTVGELRLAAVVLSIWASGYEEQRAAERKAACRCRA
jgi:hypothetical protein